MKKNGNYSLFCVYRFSDLSWLILFSSFHALSSSHCSFVLLPPPYFHKVAYGFMLAAKLALAATGDVSAARASPLPAALQAAEAAPMSAQAAEVATTLRSMVY